MARKKRAACADLNVERVLLELQSPDETVRGKAVRELCPCHAGWELFERHVGVVSRLTRDSSRAVRAHALHVFQDAAEMESIANQSYRLQIVEEMFRKKRASRFRLQEAELEAKRTVKARRRKRRGITLR